MVTPDRRRRAVVVLQGRFGVSQRRACRVVGQHRSTLRRPARPIPDADEKLCRRLRRFAKRHIRLGWRKAYDVVRREGWVVNHKKVRCLWREEGLRRPHRPSGSGAGPVTRTAPCYGPGIRIMCGRWTSSSTRPPTSAASRC